MHPLKVQPRILHRLHDPLYGLHGMPCVFSGSFASHRRMSHGLANGRLRKRKDDAANSADCCMPDGMEVQKPFGKPLGLSVGPVPVAVESDPVPARLMV